MGYTVRGAAEISPPPLPWPPPYPLEAVRAPTLWPCRTLTQIFGDEKPQDRLTDPLTYNPKRCSARSGRGNAA